MGRKNWKSFRRAKEEEGTGERNKEKEGREAKARKKEGRKERRKDGREGGWKDGVEWDVGRRKEAKKVEKVRERD